MKFKLIKIYPGSPELGTIVETNNPRINFINGGYVYDIDRNPEFWQEVTGEFILPEKWYIKVTSGNSKLVSEWVINSKNPFRKKIVEDGYLTNKWGEYTGVWFFVPIPRYTEITFEQFKKYVLEHELVEKAKEKYPIGTEYINSYGKNCTVQGILKYYYSSEGNYITDGWGGSVYKNGVWAEIIKEETKFEVGKWYYITAYKEKYEYYVKYTGSKYLEFICHGNYIDKGLFTEVEIKREITDLSEIQQYLPNGHVDKITYEILSLKTKTYNIVTLQSNGRYFYTEGNNTFDPNGFFKGSTLEDELKAGSIIHSVKRLSDGEIFTIGDKIDIRGKKDATLKWINYTNNEVAIGTSYAMVVNLWELKHCEKPLFKTEDGVDIYEGDEVTWLFRDEIKIAGTRKADKNMYIYLKYFSTKEAAEQYVLLNKPCLSINDLKNNYDCFEARGNNEIKLKELIKNKING